MEKYLVPDYTDVHEFLSHLGKRLGKLKKGIRQPVCCNSAIHNFANDNFQVDYE